LEVVSIVLRCDDGGDTIDDSGGVSDGIIERIGVDELVSEGRSGSVVDDVGVVSLDTEGVGVKLAGGKADGETENVDGTS